jgi:Flp pilus assembly pilin Flp
VLARPATSAKDTTMLRLNRVALRVMVALPLWQAEAGQGLIDYVVLLSLVTVVCLVALTQIQADNSTTLTSVAAKL